MKNPRASPKTFGSRMSKPGSSQVLTIMRRLRACSFGEPFGFGDHFAREVLTIFTAGHALGNGLELVQRQEAAPVSRLLRAANFYALAFLDRLHVGRSFMQAIARAGIQPRKS